VTDTTPAPPKKKKRGPLKKGDVLNPKGNAEFLNTVKMSLYRKRMAAAVPKTFTERQLENTLKVLLEIRDDGNIDAGHRLAACREILDRMLGKSRVDVEVEVNAHATYEVRLKAALVAARLVVSEHAPDISDGFIAGPTEGRDLENRVAIPSLPAPIHLRPDEVPGGQQGGSDGDHVQPVVQVVQEADVSPPRPSEDERTVCVQESDGCQ
jgi:hypothetical protein